MAQNFGTPRDVEISLLDYLTTEIAVYWSGVTVLHTFKDVYAKNVNLPVVCVRLSDTQSTRLEIGDNTLDDRYLLVIDIFCNSHGQRLDLAATVKDLVRVGWVHYNHSRQSGDTTGILTAIANGRDTVTEFVTDAQVDIGESVDTRDRFRHNISIRVKHQDA